jgi:chromosome segregation ATPase
MYLHHQKAIDELEKDNKIEVEEQVKETNQLKEKMDNMIREHKEMREKIENDAWDEIDAIKDKNKEDLAEFIDAGMKSKGELTLITNEYRDAKGEQERLKRDINDKQTKLQEMMALSGTLRGTIISQ